MKRRSGKTGGSGRKAWQKIAAALSLLCFLVFALPLAAGILDLSNGSAMVGFLLLAAVFRWWDPVKAGLRLLWNRTWGKVLLLVTGAAAAAVVVMLAVFVALVIGGMRAKPDQDAGTLVVLGCQVRGTAPSLLLSYRIQAAADYLIAHPDAKAVVSGGKGSGENISEAECMARGLQARGVAPERIFLEDQSRTTLENITFSRALMEREGLEGPVAIVSNDFHICRAVRMAEDLGLQAQGLAARSHWYSKPTYVLREAMALVYYVLTG